MDRFMKVIACLLCLAVMLGSVSAAGGDGLQGLGENLIRAEKSALGLKAGESLLENRELLVPGDSVSDWLAMDCALLGLPERYQDYLAGLQDYVTARYAEGGLDPWKATEWHRITLTVLALGGDPFSFGVKPDGSSIDLVADGTYAYVNGDVGLQGLNGYIYALMVLDAVNLHSTEAEKAREEYLGAILDYQDPDGGFGLTKGGTDLDITAMALQALGPYRDGEAAEAVASGLAFLSRNQDPDGSLALGGEKNCESTAQALAALYALGIGPDSDTLRKPNGTPYTALFESGTFLDENGTFVHSKSGGSDAMAASQALFALAAAYRYEKDGVWAFDFQNYAPPPELSQKQSWPVFAGIGAIVCIGFAALILIRRRSVSK